MIMSKPSSARSFGAFLIRKPVFLTRKILFLVMVPFLFLAIHYRSNNDLIVPEGLQWFSKPAEPGVEQFRLEELKPNVTVLPHRISMAALTGNRLDEEKVDEVSLEQSEKSPTDRLAQSPTQRYIPQHENAEDVTIVAARQGEDSTDWIEEFCEDYPCHAYIYSLDEEPDPEFFVPYSQKGHEGSAYLSYIIDYYDELAPYTIFLHGRAEHWHNDVSGPSTKNVLANLRYEAVALKGYVNLRCTNKPGCPSTLFQAHPVTIDFDYEYMIAQLPRILWELLDIDPNDVPGDIGHQCCAQFALTRERIQERPRSDYERILYWIATTDMTDNYGVGWLIEKLWHIIFGMPAVYCVSEEQCRCDLYGWCGPNPVTHNQMLTPIS